MTIVMHEIEWRIVPGFPDYEVSNSALIRRITRPQCAVSKNIKVPYLLNPSNGKRGYKVLRLTAGNQRRKFLGVHRILALAFLGPPPTKKHHAAHRNDIPDDNRLENIYWATNDENAKDRVRNGGYSKGERVHNSKLKEQAVRSIRETYAKGGTSQRELARANGVCQAVIRDILHRATWKHI